MKKNIYIDICYFQRKTGAALTQAVAINFTPPQHIVNSWTHVTDILGAFELRTKQSARTEFRYRVTVSDSISICRYMGSIRFLGTLLPTQTRHELMVFVIHVYALARLKNTYNQLRNQIKTIYWIKSVTISLFYNCSNGQRVSKWYARNLHISIIWIFNKVFELYIYASAISSCPYTG